MNGERTLWRSTPIAIVAIVLVVVTHVAIVFFMYGHHIRGRPIPSEILVFFLPAAVAFGSYYALLRRRQATAIPPWVTAFLLTLLSFCLSLLLPFNIYGT